MFPQRQCSIHFSESLLNSVIFTSKPGKFKRFYSATMGRECADSLTKVFRNQNNRWCFLRHVNLGREMENRVTEFGRLESFSPCLSPKSELMFYDYIDFVQFIVVLDRTMLTIMLPLELIK